MSTHRTDPSGTFGHIGFGYQSCTDFAWRAADFLADGLALGQRVIYVGDSDAQGLQTEVLAASASTAGVLLTDRVSFQDITEYFVFGDDGVQRNGNAIVDAGLMIERIAKAAISAISDGRSGLRVVVDATPIARTAEQRTGLAALEFLSDQRIATLPVAALCGYDLAQLGDAATGLLCLHPQASPHTVAFRLYSQPAERNTIALAGIVDESGAAAFEVALQQILPLLDGIAVGIDARELRSIGRAQLCLLNRCCATLGRHAVLRSQHLSLREAVELLALDNVRAETIF